MVAVGVPVMGVLAFPAKRSAGADSARGRPFVVLRPHTRPAETWDADQAVKVAIEVLCKGDAKGWTIWAGRTQTDLVAQLRAAGHGDAADRLTSSYDALIDAARRRLPRKEREALYAKLKGKAPCAGPIPHPEIPAPGKPRCPPAGSAPVTPGGALPARPAGGGSSVTREEPPPSSPARPPVGPRGPAGGGVGSPQPHGRPTRLEPEVLDAMRRRRPDLFGPPGGDAA